MQKWMPQNKFPYYTWNKGVDLYEGSQAFNFFFILGWKFGGQLIRAVDLYVSIYGMQSCSNEYLTNYVHAR